MFTRSHNKKNFTRVVTQFLTCYLAWITISSYAHYNFNKALKEVHIHSYFLPNRCFYLLEKYKIINQIDIFFQEKKAYF